MKVFVFLFFALISLKSFSQSNDVVIYKTVMQYAKQKHENSFILQDSTDSKELTTLEWQINNGKLDLGDSRQNIDDTTWKELLVKVKNINNEEIQLGSIPKLNIEYLSKEVLHNNYKDKDGWDDFYEEHSGVSGFWQFSKIVYSNDLKRALVYVAIHRNYLSATGSVYFLSFDNNIWKVKYRFELWMS